MGRAVVTRLGAAARRQQMMGMVAAVYLMQWYRHFSERHYLHAGCPVCNALATDPTPDDGGPYCEDPE
jgi:hypothetical protein